MDISVDSSFLMRIVSSATDLVFAGGSVFCLAHSLLDAGQDLVTTLQVSGPHDSARLVGGLGPCKGLRHTWLHDMLHIIVEYVQLWSAPHT